MSSIAVTARLCAAPTNEDLIEGYLAALSAERRPSARTLSAYRADLRAIAAQTAILLADAAQVDLVAALAAEQAKGLSPATLARRLSSLRGFYKHLRVEGLRADDPTAGLTGQTPPKAPLRALRLPEIDKLIAAAPALSPPAAVRAVCCIELLYGAGLRISELTGLRVSDLRGEPDVLRIRGKGQVERLTPIGQAAQRAIAAWLPYRDDGPCATSPWAFPARRGGGQIARQTLARQLKTLAAAAGVSEDVVSPHALRRSFATHMLENGADMRVIQALLGHADIAATEAYARFTDGRLGEMVREKHPLAQG